MPGKVRTLEAPTTQRPPPAPMPPAPHGTKVILKSRVAFGDAGEEREVNWPSGWRLPLTGESITVDEVAGIVSTIDFDLDRKLAVIWIKS